MLSGFSPRKTTARWNVSSKVVYCSLIEVAEKHVSENSRFYLESSFIIYTVKHLKGIKTLYDEA